MATRSAFRNSENIPVGGACVTHWTLIRIRRNEINCKKFRNITIAEQYNTKSIDRKQAFAANCTFQIPGLPLLIRWRNATGLASPPTKGTTQHFFLRINAFPGMQPEKHNVNCLCGSRIPIYRLMWTV